MKITRYPKDKPPIWANDPSEMGTPHNCNEVYAERDKCLVLMALMAQRLGLRVGIGLHVDKPGETWDADWRNILFIDLPAGQVSWHIHDSEAHMFYFVGAYDGQWDGHTTEEKYRRVVESGL